MARYQLTRPILKNGETTFYWDKLKEAQRGYTYTRSEIDNMGKYMTFQALKEAGLLKNFSGSYELTEKGEAYINIHEQKHSDPTNVNEKDFQMDIVSVLNREFDVTRVPVFLKSLGDDHITTRQSPARIVKGKDLIDSITYIETQIQALQKAQRNAEALLNGEIEGSMDPDYTGSLYYKSNPINA